MKRILLTGTALAGGMLFASVAQAQITVSLGGYTEFFAGFYDDDSSNRTNREFELETEIVVRADGKADNGLLYGAKIELQNSTGGAGATGVGTDEASVYLGGTWGRIELGDFDGAADTLKIYAPLVGIEQIDGDYGDFAAVTDPVSGLDFGGQPAFGIHIPNSGDATKAMYLTPRFAGFQAGISYTPESDSQAQNVVALKNTNAYKDWVRPELLIYN
jgi:outer membrane protein OmpU